MKKALLFSLWLCWLLPLAGQNYADSVIAIFETISDQTYLEENQAFVDSCKDHFKGMKDDATFLEALQKVNDEIIDIEANRRINSLLGRFCMARLQKDLSEEERSIFKSHLSIYHRMEGSFHWDKGEIKEAIKSVYEALKLAEEIQDSSLIVISLLDLGNKQAGNFDLDGAHQTFLKALKVAQLQADSSVTNRVYLYVGFILSRKGANEEAITYFDKCLKNLRNQEVKNKWLEYQVLEAFGMTYKEMNQQTIANDYLLEALVIAEEIGEIRMRSSIYTSLAKNYFHLKAWDQAEKYGLLAAEVGEESNLPSLKMRAASILSQIYEHEGKYKKALEMTLKAYEIRDSIQNKANTQAMLEQEYQYKYEQKTAVDSVKNAAALELQIQENKRRKAISYFSMAGLGIAFLFALILWNRFNVTKKQKVALNQANEKLKELDKEKSRFFTNISHEFRTPMTVISGMADQIEQDPEKWQQKGLEMIRRNSRQVLHLINQILDLRKLESGNMELSQVQGDVVPFLNYLLESIHSFADQKEVQLNFQTSTPSIIMDHDPEKLQAIIINLLSNAIKFTGDGGEVWLNADRVQNPVTVKTADCLLLTISDTGAGIPAEKLESIFDRFYQVDTSTTREGEGTGIGLALVKELIHLMGGTISVMSEVGKGSTFTIQLPISQNAPLAVEQGNLPSPVARVEQKAPLVILPKPSQESLPTLLIVEDNEDVVQYLTACLEDSYQLHIARNGQEGIEMAIESVPDIIISDVMMPLKDGFELCETLKLDERTSHIPIILLTAKADVESRISGLKRGADAYLAKPFNPEELQVRLDMLVKLRQSLQQRYAQPLDSLTPSEEIALQQEDAFIQKLRNTVLENLDDTDLNVTKLCDLMKMSRTQLHNKVKALTGRSATSFVRYVRLLEAQKLLQSSDLNVSEIAYEVGFNNPSYFTRVFTEEYGIAPSDARK